MKRFCAFFLLTLVSTTSFSSPRVDSNFGFGGATTNNVNATDLMAPILGPIVRIGGLDLIGMTHQLDFANAAIVDVDSERDVFWLWAGTNNILISSMTGLFDPNQAPLELFATMEKLYANQGARVFVVPNLMLLGNLPRFNTDETERNQVNEMTESHNAALSVLLEIFSATRPDATIIRLDVQSLFSELEASPEFKNVTEACFTTGLPNGTSCSEYLYADDIHFSSAAAEKIADLAAESLSNIHVRRFVTLGDSFVDTGSFFDTTQRTIGFGIPSKPSFEGRFSDGLNVIDHVERALNVDIASRAFAQPYRTTITSSAVTNLGQESDIIIAKRITLSEPIYFFSTIDVTFDQGGSCHYTIDWFISDTLSLKSCTNGLQAGDTVPAQQLSFNQYFIDGSLSLDLFYYR